MLGLTLVLLLTAAAAQDPITLDPGAAGRFAELALACVPKEYPNKLADVLNGDQDALPPRELTPAFFGCYDWHSAVHAHWLLARLARTFPDAAVAPRAKAAVARSLTPGSLRRPSPSAWCWTGSGSRRTTRRSRYSPRAAAISISPIATARCPGCRATSAPTG